MINWIITFTICSGLMLLAYHTLLARESLFRFNRFYLLGSLLFSILVSFIHIPAISSATKLNVAAESSHDAVIMTKAPSNDPVQLVIQEQTQEVIKNFNRSTALLIIYSFVTTILLIRFTINLCRILYQIDKNVQVGRLVLEDRDISPYSFFNYIFLNRCDYQDGYIKTEVICHEQAHGRQLHSIDILFIELLQVFCWFNVFIPIYRRVIQLNHEYLADTEVISQYHDKVNYQHLILTISAGEKATPSGTILSSNFNFHIIKKRLVMLNKTTTRTAGLCRQLAVFPIIAGAIILFAQKTAAANLNLSVVITPVNQQSNRPFTDADNTVTEQFSKGNLETDTILRKKQISEPKNAPKKITFAPIAKGDTIKNYKPFTLIRKSTGYTLGNDSISDKVVDHPVVLVRPLLQMIQDSAKYHDKTRYAVWIDGKLIKHEDLKKFSGVNLMLGGIVNKAPLFSDTPAVTLYLRTK